MFSLVVDVGGTNVKIGLYSNGKMLATSSFKVNSAKGLKFVLPLIEAKLKDMCIKQKVDLQDCTGLGVALAGMVNGHANKVIATTKGKYEDAPTIDLPAWADKRMGLKLRLETDVRAALVGEWRYGNAKGYSNLVGIFLGTGIGTSVLLNGRLLYGKHYQAGLLGGHFIINPHGRECTCGGRGCVTAESSTTALASIVRAHSDFEQSGLARIQSIDYENLFRLSESGDKVALQVRNRSLDIWSSCVVSLIHAFDPEMVVMGGGIMKSADIILPHIRDFVLRHSFTPGREVHIQNAQYSDEAALLGMGYIVEHGIDTI